MARKFYHWEWPGFRHTPTFYKIVRKRLKAEELTFPL